MKTFTMLIFFAGKGEMVASSPDFVRSRAEGQVLALDATSPGSATEASLQQPCKTARFDTVVMAKEGRSWEGGRVDFPDIDSHLDVTTDVPGQFKALENGFSAGSISWRVTGGGGRFAGATGVVTGNFVGHPDGSFTDHQLFKLLLPA